MTVEPESPPEGRRSPSRTLLSENRRSLAAFVSLELQKERRTLISVSDRVIFFRSYRAWERSRNGSGSSDRRDYATPYEKAMRAYWAMRRSPEYFQVTEHLIEVMQNGRRRQCRLYRLVVKST